MSQVIASQSVAHSLPPPQLMTHQLPVQSDLSPVLTEYKKYLKSCYAARALAPADKYLPTLSAPYINLAMVGREYYYPELRDEFTRQTLHGGVDQILQSKTPMDMKDLLTPEEGGRPVRFILVEGPPGIGKSTFAWEACRRWDQIENLQHYHTVVLLKLREKWVLNAASLSDLFRYPYQPEFSKTIAHELHHSEGLNLLLVMDGFDEVSHSFDKSSVIRSILCRELLPECTIILTTRPVAKAALKRMCQPEIDKHIEIIGFPEEERVKYITEVFSKESELQVNFLKYMFHVPHIKSMMYIPLNCAIIAQVYYESQINRQLAIPKTRTQLYKALTHSLLVRHKKLKDREFECYCNLPEGLNTEEMSMFKTLAKFAFDTYHEGESKKVTFFKEDIPEGLVHFGFMNESTEMYAGKGVERIFSFLHLSLQEYLAAWHLANSYSIEFQVAYHRMAAVGYLEETLPYKGEVEEEKSLCLALKGQAMKRSISVREPAIFLAGITGWGTQSNDNQNPWEKYLSHDTANINPVDTSELSVVFQSLYEAQNPVLLPHYFSAESVGYDLGNDLINDGFPPARRIITIKSGLTPYDCYALSYCLACCSNNFAAIIITDQDNTSLVETFVKGFHDHHCTPETKCSHLVFTDAGDTDIESFQRYIPWLKRSNVFSEVESVYIYAAELFKSSLTCTFLRGLDQLKLLDIYDLPWESYAAIKPLFGKLTVLRIKSECRYNPYMNDEYSPCMSKDKGSPRMSEDKGSPCMSEDEYSSSETTDISLWPEEHKLSKLKLLINFTTDNVYDISSPSDRFYDCVLKSVLRSNQINEIVLSNISHATMAGFRSILLHCPSLTRLELKRTRLGYDGILYICSVLRCNTALKHLVIHDSLPSPSPSPIGYYSGIITFSSIKLVPLPNRASCTDFLLELSNILKTNTTLEEISIQSGLFLPLSVLANEEYHQWTGLGPLGQFNAGAVSRCVSPGLRRSFSSSDLTQLQTTLFWNQSHREHEQAVEVNFKTFFDLKEARGEKLFSRPSFTAPDTEVLQSFFGLDPRLKECLEISYLNQNVEMLKKTYWGILHKAKSSVMSHYDRY